ncbi:MAG: flippase [Campylobacterota bacterium]|nr:flippase [Campylobacterota bacterium]
MILKNISLTFIEKFLTSIIGAIVSILFIRYLGPSDYGVFAYLTSLLFLFSLFSYPGLNTILVRELSQGKNIDRYFSSSLYIILPMTILGYLLFLIYGFYIESKVDPIYFLIISTGLFSAIANLFRRKFIAMQEIDVVVKYNLIIFFILNILKIFGIIFSLNFEYFLSVEAILSSFVFIHLYSKTNKIYLKKIKKLYKIVKYLFIESWPMFLTGVMIILYSRIDQFMLFKLSTESEVGFYASSVRLVELFYMFAPIIMTSFFPHISKVYKSDKVKFEFLVKTVTYVFSFFSIFIVVFTIFYAKEIVTFIFGSDFSSSYSTIQVLIFSLVFVFWSSICHKIYIIVKKQKLNFYISAVSLIVNIALNYLLIPKYGAYGAAIATVISYGSYFIIIPFVYESKFILSEIFKSTLLPTVVATISLLLTILFIEDQNILNKILVYVMLFMTISYFALKNINNESYKYLFSIIKTKIIRR